MVLPGHDQHEVTGAVKEPEGSRQLAVRKAVESQVHLRGRGKRKGQVSILALHEGVKWQNTNHFLLYGSRVFMHLTIHFYYLHFQTNLFTLHFLHWEKVLVAIVIENVYLLQTIA